MKARILPAACIFSLICLAILACGYFGRIGFAQLTTIKQGNSSAVLMRTQVIGGDGRIAWWRQETPGALADGMAPVRHELRPVIQFFPFRPPDIRRCLWEFDDHELILSAFGKARIVAFPLWCAAIPFLIAPAMWLRKWRKKRAEPAGFPLLAEETSTDGLAGRLASPSL